MNFNKVINDKTLFAKMFQYKMKLINYQNAKMYLFKPLICEGK